MIDYFEKMLRKGIKYAVVVVLIIIAWSTVSGIVSFADIIKAVIIGLCVSTANWWHERNIRPRLEKIGNGENT